MSQYILENKQLKVTVDSKGCEITSIVHKEDNRECIWCGQENIWKRHTPVLFPLVGRYKDDTSIYEGKEYKMSQHGFARDMEFELVEKSETRIEMSLSDTEVTREKYPFRFKLSIRYELVDEKVIVTWKVQNMDEKSMYFSIGGHPAFVYGETLSDAKIHFETEKDEITYGLLNENGLLKREKYTFQLDKEKNILVNPDFFNLDAYIIEGNQVKQIEIEKNHKRFVKVIFDAPVVGIWSAAEKGVPFICIEPWYGRTDGADFTGELQDREWGNRLERGCVFEKSYEIVL